MPDEEGGVTPASTALPTQDVSTPLLTVTESSVANVVGVNILSLATLAEVDPPGALPVTFPEASERRTVRVVPGG